MPTISPELRSAIHDAIDLALDRFDGRPGEAVDEASSMAAITSSSLVDGFDYRWPTDTSHFQQGTNYTVEWQGGTYELRIGLATTESYGPREGAQRGWIAIFQSRGDALYPLAEFVQTDLSEDMYAATLLEPGATGRTKAKEADEPALRRIPYLARAELRPARDVYFRMRGGETLRLVCSADDAVMLLTHALNAGRTRGVL